jgi:hypothetical protein
MDSIKKQLQTQSSSEEGAQDLDEGQSENVIGGALYRSVSLPVDSIETGVLRRVDSAPARLENVEFGAHSRIDASLPSRPNPSSLPGSSGPSHAGSDADGAVTSKRRRVG